MPSRPPEQTYSPEQPATQLSPQSSTTDTPVESLHGSTAANHDITSIVTETASGDAPYDGPVTVFGSIVNRITGSSKNAATSATEAVANNPDAAAAAAAAADSSSMTFTDFLLTPAMSVLNGVHDVTGLPWWLSIPIATIAIRTILLPVTVTTMKNSSIMAALKDDIARRREAVMEAARTGDRFLAAQRQNEMQSFMRNAGIAPMRVLIGPLVQFPVFISFFVSIRRLATSDPTMATEGLAWFTDLSAQDPIYILPVICGATLMAMTELGGDTGSTAMTPQMKLGMRIISAASIPLTYWFPAAVFCYWIPNNIFSLSLGATMRLPNVKKSLGLIVDPATIPGTRAAQLKAAQLMSGGRGSVPNFNFDPAAAAASYSRTRSASTPSVETVKPVLFKSRPKKAKTGGR